MKELILVIVGAALVNNIILSQFQGLCPFLGVSKKVDTSLGMGAAVIFVIVLASIVTNLIYTFVLVPTGLTYLQTIAFILVIAALVQLVEMFLKKNMHIVGRSADYILREKHPFRLFVYAEMEHKMERCKKRAPESEHFTDKELKRHILDVDKRRARYYQFFTGQTWGDRLNYDLCINTSNYDIKELVHAIAHLVEA